VVLLIGLGILIVGDLNRRMADARRLERDSAVLATEVVLLEQENEYLETQVAGATSEALVREWAHREGGMLQEGEVLVVPIAPPGEAAAATPTPTAYEEPPSQWQVWWALLFGG
jgi:hypothetical protein